MDATVKYQSEHNRHIHAVFRIFFFKDDVNVVIEPESEESILHIRSASRIGKYDFGVNTRRVDRFIRRLSRKL